MADKEVYTTGQVAKICNVAPRTVSKWFDVGKLKGYRLPGSRDRRIYQDDLLAFLRENGMRDATAGVGGQDQSTCNVLVVGTATQLTQQLLRVLSEKSGFVCEAFRTGFEAGVAFQERPRDVLVIDFQIGREESLTIAHTICKRPLFRRTMLVGLVAEDEGDPGRYRKDGFDAVFRKPFDPQELADRVRPQEGVSRGRQG